MDSDISSYTQYIQLYRSNDGVKTWEEEEEKIKIMKDNKEIKEIKEYNDIDDLTKWNYNGIKYNVIDEDRIDTIAFSPDNKSLAVGVTLSIKSEELKSDLQGDVNVNIIKFAQGRMMFFNINNNNKLTYTHIPTYIDYPEFTKNGKPIKHPENINDYIVKSIAFSPNNNEYVALIDRVDDMILINNEKKIINTIEIKKQSNYQSSVALLKTNENKDISMYVFSIEYMYVFSNKSTKYIENHDIKKYFPIKGNMKITSIAFSEDIEIENKVNVNATDTKGNTALILASQNGHEKVVKKLLDNGADISIEVKSGFISMQTKKKKALDYANKSDIKTILKNAEKLIEEITNDNPSLEKISSLLEHVNFKSNGYTPLMWAAE